MTKFIYLLPALIINLMSSHAIASSSSTSALNTATSINVSDLVADFIPRGLIDGEDLSVPYLDMSGNPQTGIIKVTATDKDEVLSLFNKLFAIKFKIAQITPLSNFTSMEDALSANATFSVFQSGPSDNNPSIFIFLNPIANPIIFKTEENRNITSQAETTFLLGFKGSAIKSYSTKIWPPQGIFSVNHHRKGQSSGSLTPAIADVITDAGFTRVLGDAENILFYGLIALNPLSHNGHIVTKFESKDISFDNYKIKTDDFSYQPLSEEVKNQLIKDGTWKEGCPVPLERLSLLTLKYYNYDGDVETGYAILVDVAAPHILDVFKNLFLQKFPLERVNYVSEEKKSFLGKFLSELISSDTSNLGGTGAFICRKITGGSSYSLHSYGAAIDFSYYHNPYVGLYALDKSKNYSSATIIPDYSPIKYLYRDAVSKYSNETIVDMLQKAGFYIWGGHWYSVTDYMHFQTSRFISQIIPVLNLADGQQLYGLGISDPDKVDRIIDFGMWSKLYELYPTKFTKVLVDNIDQFTIEISEYDFFDIVHQELQKI